MAIRLRTPTEEYTVEACPETLLTECARRAGLTLNMRCGGQGTCKGCTVYLEKGTFRKRGETVEVTPGESREVRGCQTELLSSNGTIFVPGPSILETSAQIEDEFLLPRMALRPRCHLVDVRVAEPNQEHFAPDRERLSLAVEEALRLAEAKATLEATRQIPKALKDASDGVVRAVVQYANGRWQITAVEPGENGVKPFWGLGVDIGTTTVAATLVDLRTGTLLRKASRYNAQIEIADDVASRISRCQTREELEEFHRLIVDRTINPMAAELCRAEGGTTDSIYRIAVSGNTVMEHLFLGISPIGIGEYPFQPAEIVFGEHPAPVLGVSANAGAYVDVVPSIAGYVGGDIVSDIYVSGIARDSRTALLVDIGTNGEMVLAAGGKLSACATAAGPAFEGHGIAHGCRAATGAIQDMTLSGDGSIELDVIGGRNVRPVGLCGTGIIAFMAEAMRTGLLNRQGRFHLERLRERNLYWEARQGKHTSHACLIAPATRPGSGSAIYVSEYDVAQILKAKGAIYAGMRTLVDMRGMRFSSLDRLVLAGGFGRHLNLRHAITIGLLPEIPIERYDVVGNGSLAGACSALIDQSVMPACEELTSVPEIVELNLAPDFEQNFIDAMMLPHFDEDEFPGVSASLPPED